MKPTFSTASECRQFDDAAACDRTIKGGLQQGPQECVKHCPTRALVFGKKKVSGESA